MMADLETVETLPSPLTLSGAVEKAYKERCLAGDELGRVF
jgi:hypothetical protein